MSGGVGNAVAALSDVIAPRKQAIQYAAAYQLEL
jgi:hypothetical protein